MRHYPAAVVEVFRGKSVESVHIIDAIIADANGNIHTAYGDDSLEIYPRSSIKSLQALSMVESGAADQYGFGDRELALACSSHNAEPMHVETARGMLISIGLSETCLECGAQVPYHPEDNALLAAEGIEPTAVHNNCSGKHAGFLAFARHAGLETKGYVGIDHAVQREIAGTLESVTGHLHNADNHGIDGCSIPTYRLPLKKLAIAYAKFGVGEAEGNLRSDAMIRLRDACLKHPEMVAGRERVCTLLMQALGNRAFVKVGAEGVYTASLPELGFGIAMKARDGNFRAVEVALSNLISSILNLEESEETAIRPLKNPTLRNRNGWEVGSLRMLEPGVD